jgi:hypothetical protein
MEVVRQINTADVEILAIFRDTVKTPAVDSPEFKPLTESSGASIMLLEK